MLFNRDEIYTDIKRRFVAMGYDFEDGSNIQQISQSMAYLISMMNANTAINIKETLLSSATRKDMITEDARLLGYEPSPRTSYTYKLKFRVKNNSNLPQKFRLDKYAKFQSGSKTYYYMGEPYIHNVDIPPNSGWVYMNPVGKEFVVKEGELKMSYPDNTENSDPTLKHIVKQVQGFSGAEGQSVFDIPYKNVEADGIIAIIVNQDDEQNLSYYSRTKTTSFMLDHEEVALKRFVRQDVVPFYTPRIYFKYADVGETLRVNDKVYFNVLLSSGQDGAASGKIENMPKYDKQGGIISETVDMEYCATDPNFDIEVTEVHLEGVGSERESDASIKKNAPLVNNSLNRLVTVTDYKSVCASQVWIKDAAVWDGYDELFKERGKVYFSFVPNPQYRTFEVNELNCQEGNEFWQIPDSALNDRVNWYMEDDIASKIQDLFSKMGKYNIPTIHLNYRQPVYLDFEFKLAIAQYNTQQSASNSNNQIFEAISNYFNPDYTDPRISKPSFGGETYSDSIVLDGRFNLKYNDLVGKKETFDSFYHTSELVDFVSDSITHGTTFSVEYDTFVNLNSKHVWVMDKIEVISFSLYADYKPLIDNSTGNVIFENLPNIETINIMSGCDLFILNEFTFVPDVIENCYCTKVYVRKNGQDYAVGIYRIIHRKKMIEVMLFTNFLSVNSFDTPNDIVSLIDAGMQDVNSKTFNYGDTDLYYDKYIQFSLNNTTYYSVFDILGSDFVTGDMRIKITYPSQNLAVCKNTIPRLKSLEIRR